MSSFILTAVGITVVVGGRLFDVLREHPKYAEIVQAVKDRNWEAIPDLYSPERKIQEFGEGKVEVIGGEVMWNGHVIDNSLTQRIVTMFDEGFDVNPLIKFLENLMKNPVKSAREELYSFLETGKQPITEDGCFLAYKRVAESWYDLHSGTVPNMPASLMDDVMYDRAMSDGIKCGNNVTVTIENNVTVVSMPRANVNADRTMTCSYGLHFCSHAYLDQFYSGSGRIVVLKINPADVVSIPSDYNDTKGRCCRYEVLYELETDANKNLPTPSFTTSVVTEDVLQDAMTTPTATSDEVRPSYIMGYDAGYVAGRNKEDRTDGWCLGGDYNAGFDVGYKDGRGKKKRLYTAVQGEQAREEIARRRSALLCKAR